MTICKTTSFFYAKISQVNETLLLEKDNESGKTLPFDIAEYKKVRVSRALDRYIIRLIEANPPTIGFQVMDVMKAAFQESKYADGRHYANAYDCQIIACDPSILGSLCRTLFYEH